jgi:BirA family biotin operon repressor/biotin-[acetyl-CoA-carboxylase] ligase
MIYRFNTLSSTNDEARKATYKGGDVVVADFQTEGRGQRGNRWSSDAGKNLMFSIVVSPKGLPASAQFVLLECVALGLVDALAEWGIATSIKWTNDIYVGDRKLVGVLIENSISDGLVARSVVGIGINVNQTEVDPTLPNPTSMALVCGRKFSCDEVLESVYRCVMLRLELLDEGCAEHLHREYCERMFRLGVEAEFALPDGSRLRGVIRGVEPQGALIVATDGGERRFLVKEVAFVL